MKLSPRDKQEYRYLFQWVAFLFIIFVLGFVIAVRIDNQEKTDRAEEINRFYQAWEFDLRYHRRHFKEFMEQIYASQTH